MTMTPSPHPAEAQEREAIDAEMQAFFDGEYMDHSTVRERLKALWQAARASHAPAAAPHGWRLVSIEAAAEIDDLLRGCRKNHAGDGYHKSRIDRARAVLSSAPQPPAPAAASGEAVEWPGTAVATTWCKDFPALAADLINHLQHMLAKANPAAGAEPEQGYDSDPQETVGELAKRVGAAETFEGYVLFGSWQAVAAFRHHVLAGAARQWQQMHGTAAGAEPMFHLRSHGDVTEAQMLALTTPPATSNPAAGAEPDDKRLTLLMAPEHLNLIVGKDRADLLSYARRVWLDGRRATPPATSERDAQKVAFANGKLTAATQHELWEKARPEPGIGHTPAQDLQWHISAFAMHLMDAISERDAEDAARLDWLIQQGNCVVAEGNKGFWLKWINEYDSNKSEFQIGEYSTPRQAIDAQREQSEKRSGEGQS